VTKCDEKALKVTAAENTTVLESRVRAGMVCVWVAGKTVRSHCYTRAISALQG